MRHKRAMTKNLRRFIGAVDELMNRPSGVEGAGLLWGDPGQGKTTAVAYVVNLYNAVFVRAVGCWTVTSMLGEICRELGGTRMLRRSDMVNWICQQLAENPRPVFIDEADYLFNQDEMLDSVRDIYDLSGCPVILIGMEDIARNIMKNRRFSRRITQWVEFKGIDLEDARELTNNVCEIPVADCLLKYLHEQAAANIGRMVVGLNKIEKFGKSFGPEGPKGGVTLAQWDGRELFYDQPVFSRRQKG